MYNIAETYPESDWTDNISAMVYEERYLYRRENTRERIDFRTRYAAVLVRIMGEILEVLPFYAEVGNTPEEAMEQIAYSPTELQSHVNVPRFKKGYVDEHGTKPFRVAEIAQLENAYVQPQLMEA